VPRVQSAIAKLEMELAPSERLLWAGQPKRGIRFTAEDFFLIPFGFAWLGFSIFWTMTALRASEVPKVPALKYVFPLFGVPFILVGVYLAFGRYWFDARRRSRTWFGISDRRILTLKEGKKRGVEAVEINTASEAELSAALTRIRLASGVSDLPTPTERRAPSGRV
jgi:hypothetical protein